MKKTGMLFFIVVLTGLTAFAQQQLPVTKKVFLGDNGRLYINKSLGSYLWISNSPDENSKKIRLFSDSTKEYTNPLYFDTEGYNTVRSPWCTDTTTKRVVYPLHDIIYEVYTDSRPPFTHRKVLTENHITINNKIYCTDPVKIILTAQDLMSGTDKIYYSIGGSPYKVYSDTLKFNTEGENILKYYSIDNTGNVEQVHEYDFNIDKSMPVTSYNIVNTGKRKAKSVELTSKDAISGVKAIYYQINNGTVKTYSIPISVKLPGKTGTLTFWSVDNVNNTENKQTLEAGKLKESN